MKSPGTAAQEGRPPTRLSAGRRLLPLSARSIRQLVGLLWLLAAGLQAQPALFGSSWWRDDLAQSVMGQPAPVSHSILWAISLMAPHAALFNALLVAAQAAIGLALVAGRLERTAIVASVALALGIWWVGEGFGSLPTGFGLVAAGAPGPVVFYPLLALLAWPRAGHGAPETEDRFARRGMVVWVTLWVGGAILQVLSPFSAARVLEANLEENADGQPGWLSGLAAHGSHLVTGHPLLVPVTLVVVQLAVGLGVAFSPTRRAALMGGVLLSLVFWFVVQALGTIPGGDATDPGAAPLVIMLGLGLWPAKLRVRSGFPAHRASARLGRRRQRAQGALAPAA